MVDAALRRAVRDLWEVAPRNQIGLTSIPAFHSLVEVVRAIHPNAGRLRFSLANAIRNLGAPCCLAPGEDRAGETADSAAIRLDAAMQSHRGRRRHLAPLDLADDIPELAFGPNRVRRLTLDELRRSMNAGAPERAFAGAEPDPRLGDLHWLVVDEEYAIEGSPERRALPLPFLAADWDPGRVDPHAGKLPSMVEDAVLHLLLAPWEDWATLPTVDWRGFRIPWVHTIDDDLFVCPRRWPSADGLAVEVRTAWDATGVEVEYEAPVVLPLDGAAQAGLAGLDDAAWTDLVEARRSPLFETPVAHFLVRAFMEDGMDEFLAHLTTVEAALGTKADYGGQARATRKLTPRLRPSSRVGARLAALLDDAAAAVDYRELFEIRSAYLHGRGMGPLSSGHRARARRVARRTVAALVARASARGDGGREDQLEALLEQGAAMTR